ncbi:hypothetical protein GP486_003528 [Trichoglossum hirsutum]|uniref:Ketosynthase family 3 (KS3) domain-containing protein n=1 Tax=Trichoglossum hirsutum TaxID=265104 RepID=A0A9P8LCW4_9PEZI|nr:hypothetical protein GP486_003528 [Trichoglossum hirsutum]
MATNGCVNGASSDMNGTSNNAVDSPQCDSTCFSGPVAIVGMAMRLPGNVTTADAFWSLLLQKKSTRCPIPPSRYSTSGFFSSQPKTGTVSAEEGYFLADTDLQCLDTSFFSMSRAEVELLDPQQRQLLEVVWECLENAGETGWRGKEIACFVGVFGEDWQDLHSKDVQEGGMYRVTGIGDFVLANRISYEYDFKGASMTIKTGCSSAMISLHMACRALQNGDCTSAIVGGTNLIMTPTMTIAMDDQHILSRTGSCKSFDAAADGYARGEAINAIYLKRLDDAIRDGDPIRAVIRGTSTNCDGKTPGIVHPSSESHEALIRRAYKAAGLRDIAKTAYVECHGTGTTIGDPLEAQAIANVFGENGVYIGSAKPNFGHSEGASGITSIIKATLALENKIIPPNINFSTPNPKSKRFASTSRVQQGV